MTVSIGDTSITETPHYVLLDDLDANRRIGPKLLPMSRGAENLAIYGFSDKGPYDRFCMASERLLKPYPLVKVFLRDEVAKQDAGVTLVVLDAPGPRAPILHAATVEAVLDAHQSHKVQVATSFRLVLIPVANVYRVEDCSGVPCGAEITKQPKSRSSEDQRESEQ